MNIIIGTLLLTFAVFLNLTYVKGPGHGRIPPLLRTRLIINQQYRTASVQMSSGAVFRGYLHPNVYQEPSAWIDAPHAFHLDGIYVQLPDGSRTVARNSLYRPAHLFLLVPRKIFLRARAHAVDIVRLTRFNPNFPHLPNQAYVAMPDGRVFAGILQLPR